MRFTDEQQQFARAVRDFCARECGTREQRLALTENGTLANMVHVGETNWVTLYPSINGVLLSFTASGTTGATKLDVVGKKAFLR